MGWKYKKKALSTKDIFNTDHPSSDCTCCLDDSNQVLTDSRGGKA